MQNQETAMTTKFNPEITLLNQETEIVANKKTNKKMTANKKSEITSDKDTLIRLADEIRKSQNKFFISLRTSLERAREIGRIANEAKQYIHNQPTKAEIKSQKSDYKKGTFEKWLKENTSLGKDTIYSMMKLDTILNEYPDFQLDKDMSWRQVLKLFKSKEQETIDIDAEEIEDEDNTIENEKLDTQRIEKDSLNKLRNKVSKLFEKFLKESENSEYKDLITQWQQLITDDVS